jgi:hypothetical protein
MLAIIIPTNGNTEDLIRYKFEEKKEKIKCIVHAWSKRNLTLYGKITIIKSSIIPQLAKLNLIRSSVFPYVGIVIPKILILSRVMVMPGEKLCV